MGSDWGKPLEIERQLTVATCVYCRDKNVPPHTRALSCEENSASTSQFSALKWRIARTGVDCYVINVEQQFVLLRGALQGSRAEDTAMMDWQ